VAPRWPRPPISGQMLHQGPHVGERCSFENIPNNRGGDGATLAARNDRRESRLRHARIAPARRHFLRAASAAGSNGG
jgi:hypothetical protein